jgi:hypothetical protein
LRILPLAAALATLPQAGWCDEPETAAKPPPEQPAAAPGKDFKLPGLVVNRKERCVDVDATICLREGALELIACTKDTKEHESIIRVEARPIHIHAALLLLGAEPGNPAMRRLVDEESGRWVDIPPRGGAVDVFLVFKDKEGKTVERPISDFIVRSDHDDSGPSGSGDQEQDDTRFPTHTFLFAGSILHGDGSGPRRYLSEESGNVISIVTFGDEVLCLPEYHSADNFALMWSIDPTHLPALDTKVTLRLKPQTRPAKADDAPPSTDPPAQAPPADQPAQAPSTDPPAQAPSTDPPAQAPPADQPAEAAPKP